jgi:hypothetical protein
VLALGIPREYIDLPHESADDSVWGVHEEEADKHLGESQLVLAPAPFRQSFRIKTKGAPASTRRQEAPAPTSTQEAPASTHSDTSGEATSPTKVNFADQVTGQDSVTATPDDSQGVQKEEGGRGGGGEGGGRRGGVEGGGGGLSPPFQAMESAAIIMDRACWKWHAHSPFVLASEDIKAVKAFVLGLPLFSGLKGGKGEELVDKLVFRYVLKTEHILRQGERDSNILYILYKGQAEAEYYSARMGAMMSASTIVKGQVLGDAAVVYHQNNLTSILARSDCKLIGVPRAVLEETGILKIMEKSMVRLADGKERGRGEFEVLIDHCFHAFHKGEDEALSKAELS